MDKNTQNNKIRTIKAKYYSKIKSIFDKSLGIDGDIYNKIDEIGQCIKECQKELSEFNTTQIQKNHVQTFENFLNNK
jgi:hypothetical protein